MQAGEKSPGGGSLGNFDSVFTELMNPKFVQKDVKLIPDLSNCKVSFGDTMTLYTTKEKTSEIKVYCEVRGHIILIKEAPNKKPIGFIDVAYSRLKLTITPEEKKLRLIKNKKYEELWNDDPEILKKWYDGLSHVCIYSNFRNDYDVLTMLGKGNFAKVYLVEEKLTKKKFSAKIFDKQLVKDDEFERVGRRSDSEMFPLRTGDDEGCRSRRLSTSPAENLEDL